MFSYDPTTPLGQVRLLAVDADAPNARFTDADISAFMALSSNNVRLSAALALDTRAAEAAIVQGFTKFAGILLDGPKVADTLSAAAAELRRQVFEGDDGSDASPFLIAEMVVDAFSYREKLISEMLRQSSGG